MAGIDYIYRENCSNEVVRSYTHGYGRFLLECGRKNESLTVLKCRELGPYTKTNAIVLIAAPTEALHRSSEKYLPELF